MVMGIKSISSAFHQSRNTVRKYVRKYQESGLRLEQMLSMSEDKLQDLFLPDLVPYLEQAAGEEITHYELTMGHVCAHCHNL